MIENGGSYTDSTPNGLHHGRYQLSDADMIDIGFTHYYQPIFHGYLGGAQLIGFQDPAN